MCTLDPNIRNSSALMLNSYLSVHGVSSARLDALPTLVNRKWRRKVSEDKPGRGRPLKHKGLVTQEYYLSDSATTPLCCRLRKYP